MLWKVGGEGNAVNGSQAPLLCDVTLEMQCLQVIHHMLNTSNRYRMDDYQNKAKFVDTDWEITTTELVHEMAEDYMRRGMNIPQSIITKLSSFQMSLGDAAHKNYVIIDDWVSEALHQLHLPAIVAGGFATCCLGHVTHHNDIDIFTYVPPWFDPFTLQWRFSPCFPHVHDGRHVSQGFGWPKSAELMNEPRLSWTVKISGADEYSGLSLQVQSTSADATRITVVECVISASCHPSLRFLLHSSENPLVMQFILLYAKDEHECLQMYADTSVMVKKIIDGFDIDLCKCFGIKWKCPTCEISCLLKFSNADDINYMHVVDEDVWPTEEHVLGWDHMWESGKQHGMELYT